MPRRRQEIGLTPEEQQQFIERGRTLYVATNGADGFPHMVAMWYVPISGLIHFTTFARSQKVLNLRRDPNITVMLESGIAYNQLKGLVIKGHGEVVEEIALTTRVLTLAGIRYSDSRTGAVVPLSPADPLPPPNPVVEGTARKRVTVRIRPVNIYSWDHAKLGGRY